MGGKLYGGAHNSAGEIGHTIGHEFDEEHFFGLARDKRDFKALGETLGILFANLANILDPEAIVLGGSVALNAKKFLPRALSVVKKHAQNRAGLPKVEVSNLKNSGALGAALLVLKQI